MKSRQFKISIVLLYLFFTTASIFAQQTLAEKIANTNIEGDVVSNGYTWRVAMKKDHTDGHRYALLYRMTTAHYGRFGANNVYSSSDVRTAINNQYKDYYKELQQIAVKPILNTGYNYSSTERTELPANPQLAGAQATDVAFLPTVQDVKDIDQFINVAATFGIMSSRQRLVTRTPLTTPQDHVCGFYHTDHKTIMNDEGLPANVNTNGNYQFRPMIWVRYGSMAPTIVNISPIGALCPGSSLMLPTPTVNANGYTITSQGWQIGSAGNFTTLTLPYIVSNTDNGKKLRYYISYSGGYVYSNEITLTVNAATELNQPDNLTFCQGEDVAPIYFSGTNVNSVSWQVITGLGSDIGLSANNGTGFIPGFYTTNITSSPVTVTIKVTLESNSDCAGDEKMFTITVNPKATSTNNLITRDTTIFWGNIVSLNDLVTSVNVPNPVFKWYLSPFETDPIYPIVFPFDLGPHYYFVSVEGDNICEGDWDTRKLVTVNVIEKMEDIEEIEVCGGTMVTLTAIPTNGGTLPTYQWKLNNENIPNATHFTYSYVPQHGDTISCEMTSNANCASPMTVQSLRVAFSVSPEPVLNQLNNLTSCHGDAFLHLSFTGTNNIDRVEWEVTSGSGMAIGMTAESGTGNIPDFMAVNTTSSPITVEISATPYSEMDCKGEVMVFTITVNPISTVSNITSRDTTVCVGSSVNLNDLVTPVGVNNPIFTWYETINGTTAMAQTIVTPNTGIYTYYVSVKGTNYCEGLADATGRKAVKVTVNDFSTVANIVFRDTTVCNGSSVNLNDLVTASGVNNPVFTWYSTLNSTTELTNLTVTPNVGTHTYYVSVKGANFCEGAADATGRKAVKVTVNDFSTVANIVFRDTTVCNGSSVNLNDLVTASGVNSPEFTWYSTINGITELTNLTVTPNVGTHTYYVSVKGANFCEGLANATGRKAVKVTVNNFSTVANIISRDTTVCSGSSVNLNDLVTANGVNSPIFTWYSTVNGTTELTNLTVTPNVGTHTYYVSVKGANFCEGLANATGRKAVTVTVNNFSTVANIIARDTTVCNGSSVNLNDLVTPSSVTNPIFTWYSTINSTTELTNLTVTPNVGTHTYYVSVKGANFCEGAADATGRKAVKVTVNDFSTVANITSRDTTVCVGSSVNLNDLVTPVGVNNPIFTWYETINGTTAMAQTIVTPNTGIYTYYVSVKGTNYCEGLADATGRKAVKVTVNNFSTVSNIIARDTTVCNGSSVNLNDLVTPSGVNNPVFTWYSTLNSTTELTNLTVTPNVGTHTYYVSVKGANFCEGLADATGRKAVKVTVNDFSTVANIVSRDTTVCNGSSVNLNDLVTASGVNSPEFTWYSTINGITELTNTTITPNAGTHTYYVSVKGANYCEGLANATGRKAVTVTVNNFSTVANIISRDTTVCSGSSVSLNDLVTPSGVTNPIFTWYSTINSTTELTNLTITPNVGTHTYYVSVKGANFCEGLADATGRKAVKVTVNNFSTVSNIIARDTTVCSGSSVNLNDLVTTSGVNSPVFTWYSTINGTTELTNLTITPNAGTHTYYVSIKGSNYCEGAADATGRKAVNVTVNNFSTVANIVSRDTTVCNGSSVSLNDLVTASGVTNPIFTWYSTVNGTTELTNLTVTPNVGTHTYYVSVKGANYCEGEANATGRKAVKVTVNDFSTVSNIIARDTTVCNGSSVNLNDLVTASGVNSPEFTWYSTINGTTELTNLTVTPSVGTYTYYVSVKGSNFCEGAANENGRKAVTVTVNDFSTVSNIIARDTTVCNGSSVSLNDLVTPSGVTNPIFTWYSTVNGITELTNTTITPNIGTHTYYVSVKGANYCEGLANATGRKAVKVTVNDFSTVSNIIARDTTVCSGSSVSLNDLVTPSGVNNPVFTWYSTLNSTTELTNLTVTHNVGTHTYYVSVKGANFCEGLADATGRKAVTVTVKPCTKVRGTVFPFVYYDYPEIDALFPVVANLYDQSILSQSIAEILSAEPLYTDTAVYYDGTEFVPNTPKYPGYLGRVDNPGLDINWEEFGLSPSTNKTSLLPKEPSSPPIGLYKFDDVQEGDYLLILSRAGYVKRFAKIAVAKGDTFLEHRELIPGDINGDLIIDNSDVTKLKPIFSYYGDAMYDPQYDLNGDLRIDMADILIMKVYLSFHLGLYKDSEACFSLSKSLIHYIETINKTKSIY